MAETTTERDTTGTEPTDAAPASPWSRRVERLAVGSVPRSAINLNVDGRRLVGPVQGFGRLWQKRYRIRLDGVDVDPAEVIRTWKSEFASFWPRGNRFYGPITAIAPGEVALLNLAMPGRQTLSTGVMVIYADDESFTFMTPEGHMFASWITFSALAEGPATVVSIEVLLRANDPFYELTMALGGHRMENEFWQTTLRNLAARFGVTAEPTLEQTCVDRRRQWRNARNIRHNAAIRTGLYVISHPWVMFRRRDDEATEGSKA
ncbi:MAG TPA: hypothetical protein VFS32_12940 [Candidatus Limnocylindrales bacterium]|nr:hypothetical protein [Candidatus Limnocylindrales bacterium]